jgi:hypothetical protein
MRFHREMLAARVLTLACSTAVLGCTGLVPPAGFSEVPATSDQNPAPTDTDTIDILGNDPELAWVRPRFDTADGPLEAGTAFVCRVEPGGSPLLLTAHHLFGPDGGHPREYHWSELHELVKGVEGLDETGTVVLVAGPPLTLEGAKGLSEDSVGNDLAAFSLRGPTRIHAIPLARSEPAVDEPVWLIGPTLGDRHLRHRAVVSEIGADYMIYVYDEPLELQATSGAAVVNADNEVVAVNLGGGSEGDMLWGIGNPVSSIRRHLAAAANRSRP